MPNYYADGLSISWCCLCCRCAVVRCPLSCSCRTCPGAAPGGGRRARSWLGLGLSGPLPPSGAPSCGPIRASSATKSCLGRPRPRPGARSQEPGAQPTPRTNKSASLVGIYRDLFPIRRAAFSVPFSPLVSALVHIREGRKEKERRSGLLLFIYTGTN
jgi:hypothetical protein